MRGSEICLLPRNQIAVGGDEKSVAGGSKTPPLSYVDTFRKIRSEGKQNVAHRSKMFIIHEKTSRLVSLLFYMCVIVVVIIVNCIVCVT